MIQDKYIGLVLAVSSSVAIGTSFIITKKGLNDAAERNPAALAASEDLAYLRNPLWWTGTGLFANFAAYSFAPPILVTPLGFLSVLIGAVLASIFLQEELGHVGRIGCSLCILGAIIIVAHAPPDQDITTVDQILFYAVQPGFLMYCFTVLIFALVMIYSVAPKYGKKNPIIYLSICSLVGSVSVMAAKGFGIAIKLTLAGNNQFSHPSTYVFGIVVAICILVQMTYFNKALDTFSTNVVNPIYYVTFTTATIVASLILFQGFNTTDAVNTISLIDGFLITFFGVHLLNSSLDGDRSRPIGHLPLENGLMTPRLSISGRLSHDSWGPGHARGGSRGYSQDIAPFPAGHDRRSNFPQSNSTTLFNAYDEDGGGVGLDSLREEEEEAGSEGDVSAEQALLRSNLNRASHNGPGRQPIPSRGKDNRRLHNGPLHVT